MSSIISANFSIEHLILSLSLLFLLLYCYYYDYYSGGGEDDDKRIALGVNQTSAHSPQETYVCILCQEVSASDNQSTIVYSALVQKYVCPASLSLHYQQLNSPVTELSVT